MIIKHEWRYRSWSRIKCSFFFRNTKQLKLQSNLKQIQKMVTLRSGKDVPFLGKNIPKRNKKQTSGQLTKQQLSKASESSQNISLSSTSDAMESFISDLPKHSHISTCPDINGKLGVRGHKHNVGFRYRMYDDRRYSWDYELWGFPVYASIKPIFLIFTSYRKVPR